MTELPGGVWPAMFSPLTEDGEPNLTMIDKLIELYLHQQLDGVYVLGGTGQGPAMTMAMRKTITAHTVKAAHGRLPVIVHVGTVATADAVELAKHAADAGVDGVSSVPPFYFPSSAEVELEHYRQIAAATSLPFFPYFNPAVPGGASVAIDRHVHELTKIPNIYGMKLTTRDMYMFGVAHVASEGKLKIYSGADELICHATLSGSHGAIGTSYSLFGAACRKMRCACMEGRFETARSFMLTFQEVINKVLSSDNHYQFFRQGLQLRHGIDIGPGRAPYCAVGRKWDESEVMRLCDTIDVAAGL